MKRFKIKIIKLWDFSLDAENRDDVYKKIDDLMDNSVILDLPQVKKLVKIKISRVRNFKNEKN